MIIGGKPVQFSRTVYVFRKQQLVRDFTLDDVSAETNQKPLIIVFPYRQLSPCGHPAITDTPIIRTEAKSQAKTIYRPRLAN